MGAVGKRPQSRKKETANILATDLIKFFSGKSAKEQAGTEIFAGRPILDGKLGRYGPVRGAPARMYETNSKLTLCRSC